MPFGAVYAQVLASAPRKTLIAKAIACGVTAYLVWIAWPRAVRRAARAAGDAAMLRAELVAARVPGHFGVLDTAERTPGSDPVKLRSLLERCLGGPLPRSLDRRLLECWKNIDVLEPLWRRPVEDAYRERFLGDATPAERIAPFEAAAINGFFVYDGSPRVPMTPILSRREAFVRSREFLERVIHVDYYQPARSIWRVRALVTPDGSTHASDGGHEGPFGVFLDARILLPPTQAHGGTAPLRSEHATLAEAIAAARTLHATYKQAACIAERTVVG